MAGIKRYQSITVKEARKLLGAQAKDMSDGQIRDVIINLEELARCFMKSPGSKK